MKTLKKYAVGLASLMLVLSFNALSMDKKVAAWARLAGDCFLGKVPVSQLSKPQPVKDPFPFTSLLPELQMLIITLITNGLNAKSVREAAQAISSLAQVNDDLNQLINDRDFALQLIKNLSQRFKCANVDICKEIQTKQVKQQCDLQKQLFDLCKQQHPNKHLFALLCSQGVDLTFTDNYNNHIASPLMVACFNNSELIPDILATDANNMKGLINQSTPSGVTALMVTAQTNNQFAMRQLIANQYIDINKKDLQGNTALMYAIESKNILYVRALLAKGANPTLANAQRITPLAAAQKTGDSQISDALFEAANSYRK